MPIVKSRKTRISSRKMLLDCLGTPLDDHKIQDSIATALLITDLEGTVCSFNKAAEEMFGITKEEAVGTKYYHRLAAEEEERLQQVFHHVVQTGRAYCDHDITFYTQAGRELILNPHVSLIRDDLGQGVGIVMMVEDVTEKRRMEKVLRRREKLAALGEVALGIAHELKNPLSSIKGFANLVKSDLGADHSNQKYLDIIIREVDRIDRLSQELLVTARNPDIENFVCMQVNDIIQQVVKRFELENLWPQTLIKTSLHPALPLIWGEPERIKHMLANLISNAHQSITDYGHIFIKTEIIGGSVIITIRDTGLGIPSDVVDRIFDPFFTTKATGTGLGLAIVHNIVTNHWGHIEVESAPGKGTVFSVRLPVMERMKVFD